MLASEQPSKLRWTDDEANEVAVLARHRDYSFDEWVALTPERKFEILPHSQLLGGAM